MRPKVSDRVNRDGSNPLPIPGPLDPHRPPEKISIDGCSSASKTEASQTSGKKQGDRLVAGPDHARIAPRSNCAESFLRRRLLLSAVRFYQVVHQRVGGFRWN